MTNKTKTDAEKIGDKNPFAEKLEVLVNKRIDMSSLKLEDGDWIPQEYEYERASITKVYRTVDNRALINKLSLPAKELYLWLIYKVEYGEDWIRINRKSYMEEHGISSVNTYKKAVVDLVFGGAIAYTVLKDVFWINPKLFFAGSRVKKYPNNVKIYEPKKDKE